MLCLSLCLALAMPQGGSAPVVINEFSYDDSGTDDREFVELYNRSAAPVDIGNWVLDSEDPNGPNTAYTIPAGTMLNSGDYWVMGSAIVPGVDQVVGTTNIWENDNESLTLRDTNGRVVDTLVYEANKGLWNPALAEGEGIWGNLTSIDGVETSWSRIRDGADTDDNGYDFVLVPSTPGASNDLSMTSYADNFDAATIGTPPVGWGGSFVLPSVEDPTVASTANPSAIPASPQGGNVAIFWDPSGGGDANMLLHEVNGDTVFQAWVYIDSTLQPNAGENETWSIGFGTTGTFYNTPDPSGALGFTANGNTGVSWTYQSTDSGVTMYFIDHNNGGWGAGAMSDATVVGSFPIVTGLNDGWQAIRLERFGNTVVGSFGGTYGCADGTRSFSTQVAYTGPTTLYVGYREFVTDNSTLRPVTLDDVVVRPSTSAVTDFGSGSPTTTGQPMLSTNGPPAIGWQGFEVLVSDAVPGPSTVVTIGIQRLQPPMSLASIGGQPGADVLVMPVLFVHVPIGPGGDGVVPVPLRCEPAWLGVALQWQGFVVDGALPYALPIATTQGLETLIGN